jgi:type 1 fimbria pilin
MKVSAFSFLLTVFIFFCCNRAEAATFSDTTQTDTAQTQIIQSDTSTTYTHVDVVVETEWGGPEKNEDVTAEVGFKDGKPDHVVMRGVRYKQCEITLMEGMTVKIYNHKTGKLLKTYKG